MRRYIIGRGWGPHPAAAESPKEKEKEKGKPKNQKFEALYNREGLGPPPGNRASPKIRNLRPYIIGRGWGPHPAAAESPKEKEREKGKPKNQKFEALYNREGLGPPLLGASWGILEGFWRVFEESCMDLGGLGRFGRDFRGIVRILGGFWGGLGGPRKS